MRFTLEIDCDNAALDEDYEDEIVRLACVAASRSANDYPLISGGKLLDTNGNTVGKWELS